MLVPYQGARYPETGISGSLGGSAEESQLLEKFEADLTKVPGVKSARVVGNGGTDEPSEIHIVASSDRSPKQVVRDVQSLAIAGYQLSIDHRIVSVVQLDEAENGHNLGRPAIRYITVTNDTNGCRVDLGLEWPGGSTTGGGKQVGNSKEARARAGAEAMVQAVQARLQARGTVIDLENLWVAQANEGDAVVVRLLVSESGATQTLVGSAVSEDDVVSATARATLHALNRRLSLG